MKWIIGKPTKPGLYYISIYGQGGSWTRLAKVFRYFPPGIDLDHTLSATDKLNFIGSNPTVLVYQLLDAEKSSFEDRKEVSKEWIDAYIEIPEAPPFTLTDEEYEMLKKTK
jgi:hypothetical protein